MEPKRNKKPLTLKEQEQIWRDATQAVRAFGDAAKRLADLLKEFGPPPPQERYAGGWDHATGQPIEDEGGERGN